MHARGGDGRRPHPPRSRMARVVFFSIAVALIESHFSILGLWRIIPVHVALRLVIAISPWICTALVCTALWLLVLSQYMGPIYLKSSNTFAKYCDMLYRLPFQRHHGVLSSQGTPTYCMMMMTAAYHSCNRRQFWIWNRPGCRPSVFRLTLQIMTATLTMTTRDKKLWSSSQVRQDSSALFYYENSYYTDVRSRLILGGVIVIVRPNGGKSARERVDHLLSQPMYDFLSAAKMKSLVHIIEGDVTLPECGMQREDIKLMCLRDILHVFHCAAAVSFSQSLEDAAVSNITSSLQLHVLTKRLSRGRNDDVKFVYISTAFVHGGKTGLASKPLPKEVFSLRQYDPVELYKLMLGSQSYASAAMKDLGHPNTYTFSKCRCEQLLRASSGGEGGGVKTIIIRPSIVGSSVKNPPRDGRGLPA